MTKDLNMSNILCVMYNMDEVVLLFHSQRQNVMTWIIVDQFVFSSRFQWNHHCLLQSPSDSTPLVSGEYSFQHIEFRCGDATTIVRRFSTFDHVSCLSFVSSNGLSWLEMTLAVPSSSFLIHGEWRQRSSLLLP